MRLPPHTPSRTVTVRTKKAPESCSLRSYRLHHALTTYLQRNKGDKHGHGHVRKERLQAFLTNVQRSKKAWNSLHERNASNDSNDILVFQGDG